MERVRLISDYTPLDEVNYLDIIRDDQGDIHLNLIKESDSERGIRIAVSGTRYSYKVRQALYELISAIKNNKGP